MERKFFDEVVVDNYEGNKSTMRLTYYLLTKPLDENFCDLKVYGVEIVKHVIYKTGAQEKERKLIDDLFFEKKEAVNFIYKLAKNTVTPMGLKYVLHDYIEEQIKIKTPERISK